MVEKVGEGPIEYPLPDGRRITSRAEYFAVIDEPITPEFVERMYRVAKEDIADHPVDLTWLEMPREG